MRFNKLELTSLAAQPPHKFEKEGVLFIRERQEGFFRKTEKPGSKPKKFGCYGSGFGRVSVERWCRLRGNLLFYFKSRDHWSEPAGVIIVEGCQVIGDNNPKECTFGILLVFGGGHQLHLATYTEDERDSWVIALRSASHSQMRQQLETLQKKLKAKLLSLGLNGEAEALGDTNITENLTDTIGDFDDKPLLETWVSCDNLLCDALGRAPSARLTLTFRNNSSLPYWRSLGQTEIAEKSSNPVFYRTFLMFEKLGFNDDTEVKISAYDTRDRFTATRTLLGSACIFVKDMKEKGRTRLKLNSPNPDGRTAGFVTLATKSFESKVTGSTDSTPVHCSNLNNANVSGIQENESDLTDQKASHRRSQSLPPSSTRGNIKFPKITDLAIIFENPVLKTYRFHSGLGGDIIVQEVMSESRLSFTFPQQLLSLWICEEKELVHEMAALGELKAPWHDCQMSWLENHLDIINTYSHGLENLDRYEGPSFRKSIYKDDPTYNFVPTNLHFQRICVENDSLRKTGIYDVITHGAFTSIGMKSPGLIKMLKDLKAPQKDSTVWCSESDRLQMAEDTLGAVRRVRKEVVECMRLLMKLARDRKRDGMISIVEDMLRKTKCLCSLLDLTMVEEVFAFLEENRVNIRPEKDEFSESVAEFMQRNRLKIDLPLVRPNKMDTLQTPCAEFLSKELRTPDIENIFSPQGLDGNSADYWKTYSAYTSGYQSVDRLSDIDEFEENFRYLSVVDKTKHYYTLCRNSSPIDTPIGSPNPTPKKSGFGEALKNEAVEKVELEAINSNDEGIGDDKIQVIVAEDSDGNDDEDPSDEDSDGEENVTKKKDKEGPKDQGLVSESAAGLYYKAGDEPEPIDLTHLNIEAAMMCLASKVRYLSGKADSPTLSSRTFRFKELDLARKARNGLQAMKETPKEALTYQNIPGPQTKETDALQDWASELRPSMRKLRQGMDSLCKTARLSCSVLRLQQQSEAVTLSHDVRHRRDVCFSQALTTLISGLMGRLWCSQPDPNFLSICFSLGPLVSFESLLSLYGEDLTIFNDMIVAVEDLRNVEFSLIMVDKRTKLNAQPKTSTPESKDGKLNILEYHTFPLPRVTGSRSSLKVMLPVPGYVYTILPVEQIKSAKFSVTPVFFNIGINQNATLAAKLGYNGPQEKNNLDNFKIISEYHRRLKKLSLPPQQNGSCGTKRFSTYQNEPDIEDLLAILKSEVNNKKNKNVEVLHLVSNITRRLNGLRFTSCKSGKDRTGMSVSLEQVQILSKDYDLDENEFQKALDVMRSEGTRRSNTEKNVGKRLYAFNSLQLTTFPYQYRPPVGSYGNVET